MKTTKVYLQKPWKFSEDSPYYISLKKYPPRNIKFIQKDEFKFIHSGKKFKYIGIIKGVGRNILSFLNRSMPNSILTSKSENIDLIHCERCLSKNNTPWVCDIEWVGQFWKTGSPRGSEDKIKKYLESDNCKKIMAWTEWCSGEIIERFPSVKNKVEVVYPAIEEQKITRDFNKKKITLLFVARRFYEKGGLYACEVIDRITKKYNFVEGIVIGETPKKVLDRYEKNKKISFLSMIPRERLFREFYPKSDIFVYPGFIDSFGFPIIEAMSFGIPIVSVEGAVRRELIKENYTGFVIEGKQLSKRYMENLVDLEVIEGMCKRIISLIEDRKLLRKMSKNCIREIKTGKFSIRERNKKLSKIYLEATSND